MAFQVTGGVIPRPQKVLVYGTEGIGKTTLAAQFPSPLFIDTEGGSSAYDVRRLPAPTSWQMLLDEVTWVRDYPAECGGTLVVDTLDWAERMCNEAVCSKAGKDGIEGFGYGKGYVYAKEEFGKLLNLLSECADRGLNVCATAHACIQKFEQPDEMGAYDRWELKLSRKHVAPMVKEWADAVLFADYKTVVIETEGGKRKAQGGKNRVLRCTHAATWDAKNRWGLPDEVPMEWAQIAPYIPVPSFGATQKPQAQHPVTEAELAEARTAPVPFAETEPVPQRAAELPDHMKPLADLMAADGVTDGQLMAAMAKKGYLPAGMPLADWPQDTAAFVVSVWPQVREYISSGMPDEK